MAFLCADLALTPEAGEDHAAYIQSCLKVLKNDKRAIFAVAAHAQRAADLRHGLQTVEEGRGRRVMRRLRLLVMQSLRPPVADAKEKMMPKETSFVELDASICILFEN